VIAENCRLTAAWPGAAKRFVVRSTSLTTIAGGIVCDGRGAVGRSVGRSKTANQLSDDSAPFMSCCYRTFDVIVVGGGGGDRGKWLHSTN